MDESIEFMKTAAAPAYRPPLEKIVPAGLHTSKLMSPGTRLDDFEILRLLGTGSFARVYLAWQTSLSRHVALKISVDEGSEARTMAHLEHAHIVQVFAET